MWNAAKESTSPTVFGRAFQSLGAELENALKPNCFLMCFLAPLHRHGCNDERRGYAGICQGMSSCVTIYQGVSFCKYSGTVPS